MELNKQFINPYNFVRYNDSIKRRSSSEYDNSEKVTGYIECALKVAEKLALPDHENVTEGKYDFFKVNDIPVIPGSEIKGCIRSLYEALTNSCFSVINANTLTYRPAVNWKKISNPAIAKYDTTEKKWYLYPAFKVEKKDRANYDTSEMIKRSWKASPKLKIDYITQFYASEYNDKIDCSSKMDGFKELIEIFLRNNDSDKKFKGYINDLKKAVENRQPFVAFYRLDEKKELTYFSPAQISRTSFNNKVTDFLGDHSACTGEDDKYCSGCRLFGTLGNNNPIASKLRFSDAVLVGDSVKISPSYDILPALSSPKITSIEFYSSRGKQFENVERWDYDSTGVTLRGRKFYFHSLPINENDNPNINHNLQFETKCALKDSKFAFKVYFDNISKEELGKLLWVLALGENRENSDYMQKIGAGKPVGYGSVKITVANVALRSAKNYSISKHSYDDFASDEKVFDPTALKDIKHICNYTYLSSENKKLVSYPVGDDGKGKPTSVGALQWFANNRTTDGKFRLVLPTLTDSSDALIMNSLLPCPNVSVSKNSNSGSGRNNGQHKRNKDNAGYRNEKNNNNRSNDEKPIFSKITDYSLKCEVCKKTEVVSYDVYKQRKSGGYKCKDCRKKNNAPKK